MKTIKFLIIALMMCFTSISFSQSISSEKLIKLPQDITIYKKQLVDGKDTSVYYSMIFRDCQYQYITEYKSIQFSKDEFKLFLTFCTKVISEETINVSHFYKDDIMIVTNKITGIYYINFWADKPSGYNWLKQKQIDKIISKLE